MKKSLITVLATVVLLSGCSALFYSQQTRRDGNSSNLVDFLYPDREIPPPQNAVPELQLPLRVGIAFLPAKPGSASSLDPTLKQAILERVRERFATRQFVREITVIPDYYLSGRRGFEGLAALQRLYSVDLVALVSYDQVARQDDRKSSLAYLTIVGAYVIKGTHQDVNTLMDMAVVHPATRSLVLRAGGTDSRDASSTAVDAGRSEHEMRVASFNAAAGSMIDNLDIELKGFEDAVRRGDARVHITSSGDTGGAGSFDWLIVAMLGGLAALRLRRATSDQAAAGSVS